MSQCSSILAELRSRRHLGPELGPTARDFYKLCGTLAASSRIDELRKQGHIISCNKLSGDGRSHYYLEYDAELDGPKVNYSPELKAAGF